MRRLAFFSIALAACACFAVSSAHAQAPATPTMGPVRLSFQPELDAGFHSLYELKFAEARAHFGAWSAAHPDAALGPAAQAASYLFEEFESQGVLTSEFFLDDDRLLGGIEGRVDPQRRDAFLKSAHRAQE